MEYSNLKDFRIGFSETCSNLSCTNTITLDRGTEDISEAEKRYGLLCDDCKTFIDKRKYFFVECLNCGSLVNVVRKIKYVSRKKKGYCYNCINCGDFKYAYGVVVNFFDIKLFRFMIKIEKLFLKKDKYRKPGIKEKERFEDFMKHI